MNEVSGQWLVRVRFEIDKARQELREEHERLLVEREKLEAQITTLENEMGMLRRIESQSDASNDSLPRSVPLSHRVIEVLERSQSELTFRQMREQLRLDRRESRNLGPVLNQFMRAGKVASPARGAPWRLVCASGGGGVEAVAARGSSPSAAREAHL